MRIGRQSFIFQTIEIIPKTDLARLNTPNTGSDLKASNMTSKIRKKTPVVTSRLSLKVWILLPIEICSFSKIFNQLRSKVNQASLKFLLNPFLSTKIRFKIKSLKKKRKLWVQTWGNWSKNFCKIKKMTLKNWAQQGVRLWQKTWVPSEYLTCPTTKQMP